MQVYDYALTTFERVKERLTIDNKNNDFDDKLTSAINSASDFIENYCNRKFASRSYAGEIYSVHGIEQRELFLRQYPVQSIESLQYAAGTPSNKNWTDYMPDDYELADEGRNGRIHMWTVLLHGTNTVKASYTAGYDIDWESYGDLNRHSLPADLTDLCERIVTKIFKKRDAEGRDEEQFDSSRVVWSSELKKEDYTILNKYKRYPLFT